jgi:hypothetical protein
VLGLAEYAAVLALDAFDADAVADAVADSAGSPAEPGAAAAV